MPRKQAISVLNDLCVKHVANHRQANQSTKNTKKEFVISDMLSFDGSNPIAILVLI
jgi:hypothetical protein